jgi:hypothetical protein
MKNAKPREEFNPRDIHVTDVGSCPGKYWFSLIKAKPLGYSTAGLRGTMAHNFIYQTETGDHEGFIGLIENDRLENVDYQVYRKIVDEDLLQIKSNYFSWVASTELDLSNSTHEQEFRKPINGSGFTLTGTIDRFNPRLVLDYKTGAINVRDEYIAQLAAYRDILLGPAIQQDGSLGQRKCYLVFLSNGGPKEVEIKESDLSSELEIFKERLKMDIEQRAHILQEFQMPRFKPTLLHCNYCRYIHLCDKVGGR